MRIPMLVVLLALAASPGAAAPPAPGPACDFRAVTLSALFAAANETARAGAALDAGDGAAAAARLGGAAGLLLAERQHVARLGRAELAKDERKPLLSSLRAARRFARRSARLAAKRPAAEVRPLIVLGAAMLDTTLEQQVTEHAARACGGLAVRVPELVVEHGAVRSVPAGTTITAELGVTILGDLVAPGGITIEAESGDLVLEGGVDAHYGARLDVARAARGDEAALAARSARGATAPPASCGDAEDVVFRARRGNVRIGSRFLGAAGDGGDCTPLTVTDRAQLEETTFSGPRLRLAGRSGGKGGSVRVSARAGAIRFATRPLDDPGVFWPGNGGRGQDLTIDAAFAPPSGFGSIHLVAGDGGPAGSLELDSPSADTLPLYRVLAESVGGHGGDIDWDVRVGGALFPSGLATVYAVAGSGGDGATSGGNGGEARYYGDRVVNGPGEPTTEVFASGGSGGSVFAGVPRMPADATQGGHGGGAAATGHRGADGTEEEPAGAVGGRVEVTGGGGGSVPNDPARSSAGDGGSASGWGGRGGRGFPSCAAAPGAGGRGGAGGTAYVEGGSGGFAPAGQAGDGGDSVAAFAGQPGEGGDGAPAGACGSEAARPASIWGIGGEGAVPGENGTAVSTQSPACTAAAFTCEELGPRRDPCVSPRFYGAHVTDYQGAPDGSIYTIFENVLSGYEVCTGNFCNSAHHTVHTTERRKSFNQTEEAVIRFDPRETDWGSLVFGTHRDLLWYDHCTGDGELHRAGMPGTDVVRTSPTFVQRVAHACVGACACSSTAVRCCLQENGAWWPSDDLICH
jgi:hypothetical protein